MNRVKKRGLWVGLLLLGLAVIAACTPQNQATAPNIVAFTANPASIEVGQSSNLSWNVRGASNVVITDEEDNEVVNTDEGTGSIEVTPDTEGGHTYTLSATNSNGTNTSTTVVTVTASTGPVINTFTATPLTIAVGEDSVLEWDVSGANSIVITDQDDAEVVDSPEASGTHTVTLDAEGTYTYTLTAENSGGTVTRDVSILVTSEADTLPVIVAFAATPATIVSGDISTLEWEVSNFDSLVITDEDDNEVAAPTEATGSLTVSPTENTTYTLTATNATGQREMTTTVTVNEATPPTVSGLTAEIVPGSRVDLTWTATNASSIDIYAVPDPSDTSQDELITSASGTDTGATVDIPASDRLTIKVVASGSGSTSAEASVTLANVVYSSGDYDPYDLQGMTADDPVPGTLRQVIIEAQAGDVIGFASDIDTVELYGVDVVFLPGYPSSIDSHVTILKDLTISGPESGVTFEVVQHPDAGGADSDPRTWRSRVVFVGPEVDVVLENLTLTGGDTIFVGAGVRNDGNLTINNSLITGNRAWHNGGGIYNHDDAVLVINDSTVSNNEAAVFATEVDEQLVLRDIGQEDEGTPQTIDDGGYGGGIFNRGTVTVNSGSVASNTAKWSGGGIYNVEGGTLTVTGATVQGNTADLSLPAYDDDDSEGRFSWGGGILNAGTATVSDSDVSENFALYNGGGLYVTAPSQGTLTDVDFNFNEAEYGGAIFQVHYIGDTGNLVLNGVPDNGNNIAGTSPFHHFDPIPEPASALQPMGVTVGGLWTPPSTADEGKIYR